MEPIDRKIALRDFPQLQLIAWNRRPDDLLTEEDAFGLYEANWHFVDLSTLEPHEQALIAHLTKVIGNGLMNV